MLAQRTQHSDLLLGHPRMRLVEAGEMPDPTRRASFRKSKPGIHNRKLILFDLLDDASEVREKLPLFKIQRQEPQTEFQNDVAESVGIQPQNGVVVWAAGSLSRSVTGRDQ